MKNLHVISYLRQEGTSIKTCHKKFIKECGFLSLKKDETKQKCVLEIQASRKHKFERFCKEVVT